MTVRQDLITAALALASDKNYCVRERAEASRTATYFLAQEEATEAERVADYRDASPEAAEARADINTEYQRACWGAAVAHGVSAGRVLRVDPEDCVRAVVGEGPEFWIMVDLEAGTAGRVLYAQKDPTGTMTHDFKKFTGHRAAVGLYMLPITYATKLVRDMKRVPGAQIYVIEKPDGQVLVGVCRIVTLLQMPEAPSYAPHG